MKFDNLKHEVAAESSQLAQEASVAQWRRSNIPLTSQQRPRLHLSPDAERHTPTQMV